MGELGWLEVIEEWNRRCITCNKELSKRIDGLDERGKVRR